MNKMYLMSVQRIHALDMFIQTITDESAMMEVAEIYPLYEVNKSYKIGNIFQYGVNADDEAQLYQVLQEHVSAEQWKPDETPSLYKKIGFNPSGIPIWTQPLGASDAYMMGDLVEHKGQIWISDVDYNVWEPGVYYGWTARN